VTPSVLRFQGSWVLRPCPAPGDTLLRYIAIGFLFPFSFHFPFPRRGLVRLANSSPPSDFPRTFAIVPTSTDTRVHGYFSISASPPRAPLPSPPGSASSGSNGPVFDDTHAPEYHPAKILYVRTALGLRNILFHVFLFLPPPGFFGR